MNFHVKPQPINMRYFFEENLNEEEIEEGEEEIDESEEMEDEPLQDE